MQLTLPVSLPVNQTFESYYVGEHSEVVDHLTELCAKQTDFDVPVSVLCGGEGTGKSHLLFSVCHKGDRQGLGCVYINLDELDSLNPLVFEDLEQQAIICVDNIEALAGNDVWENALFDLINRVIENKNTISKPHIVFTCKALPKFIKFDLPDLLSRLQWGTTFTLNEPQDEQRRHIVALRAEQKGLILSDSACSYLLTRSNRHLSVLMDTLDELDKLSLQAQRKITVPLLKEVLD